MTIVSMNYLLESGVHFGHQKRRWNPKMKEYIYTTRDDIYIIDLQKTSKKLESSYSLEQKNKPKKHVKNLLLEPICISLTKDG